MTEQDAALVAKLRGLETHGSQLACEAADRIEALSAEVERLRGALRSARQIIAQIDEYMKRPDRGDWGVECACCMGELLDDDREAIARIDAALAGDSHDHR